MTFAFSNALDEKMILRLPRLARMEIVKDEWCCESKTSTSGLATVVEYGTTPMLGVTSDELRGWVAIVVSFRCGGYCCGLYYCWLYC